MPARWWRSRREATARSSSPMAGISSRGWKRPARSLPARRPDRACRPADGECARGPVRRPADEGDRGRDVPAAAVDLGRPEARRRLRLGPARPRASGSSSASPISRRQRFSRYQANRRPASTTTMRPCVRFANGASGVAVRLRDLAEGAPGADRPPHLRLRGHAPPRHRARAPRASPPRRQATTVVPLKPGDGAYTCDGAAAGARRSLSRQTGAERRARHGRPARRRGARRHVPLGRERPDGAGVMNRMRIVGWAKRSVPTRLRVFRHAWSAWARFALPTLQTLGSRHEQGPAPWRPRSPHRRGHRPARLLDAVGRADHPAISLHLPQCRGADARLAHDRGMRWRASCRRRSKP